MSFREFHNELNTQGLLRDTGMNSIKLWRFILHSVTSYPQDYTRSIDGQFDDDFLATVLSDTYPSLSELSCDCYTFADEIAMAFMFSYCDEVGGDYYLPGDE